LYYYGEAKCVCGHAHGLINAELRRFVFPCVCGVIIDLFLDIPETEIKDEEVQDLINMLKYYGADFSYRLIERD
jgi:hypothetical protein